MITRLVIFAFGVVLVIAVGYFGALGGGRGDAGVARAIEMDLQEKVNAALAQSELGWASVVMDGQNAILRGQAPRDEERAQARTLVFNAAGHGGFWLGGVAVVVDESTLAPPLSPYVFTARREGGRLVVAGAAPSQAALDDLTTYARQLFPGGVVANVQIARGAPDDLAWENALRIAVTQLANLRSGTVTITDREFLVEGGVDEPAALTRIERDSASLPSIFNIAVNVTVNNDGSDLMGGVRTQLQPIATARECQRQVRLALGTDVIRFEPGRAAIQKESYPVLDRVVSVARRCTAARVTAVGRAVRSRASSGVAATEGGDVDQGAGDVLEAGNAQLWGDRAQAVADYFVLKGVPADRALAQGEVVDAGTPGIVLRVAA